MFSSCSPHACSELGIVMYWSGNSMNNLLSYYGLVDAKIRASNIDLPVIWLPFFYILSVCVERWNKHQKCHCCHICVKQSPWIARTQSLGTCWRPFGRATSETQQHFRKKGCIGGQWKEQQSMCSSHVFTNPEFSILIVFSWKSCLYDKK